MLRSGADLSAEYYPKFSAMNLDPVNPVKFILPLWMKKSRNDSRDIVSVLGEALIQGDL